ncbi:hypothetical protein [Undibacterium sp. YM2]|nr:hypothetical protein [Undibacterium sp. YM2]
MCAAHQGKARSRAHAGMMDAGSSLACNAGIRSRFKTMHATTLQ